VFLEVFCAGATAFSLINSLTGRRGANSLFRSSKNNQQRCQICYAMRISYEDLYEGLRRVLLDVGFTQPRAELCAHLFIDATVDGVYTHGVNRFPRFLEMIRRGVIDIHAEPKLVASYGAIERWDGRRGPGNLNADAAMKRAIAISREQGMGCVALGNTNHWMRGGSYGWQAAEAGVIGICWTNTLPNLPPWGASEPRLGNNPLVIAVPRSEGHIVLDMAMSQFSIGALESYKARGAELPVAGGFDSNGKPTRDAAAILTSGRTLPIGYWKGSGLALMLDLLATVLSGGKATFQIPKDSHQETGLSQMFLAFDLGSIDNDQLTEGIVNQIIDFVHGAAAFGDEKVRYPGERRLEVRKQNLAEGIPVEPEIWERIQQL
jgi:3-dehydro-L-gulonate 2-dehydrogenase